MKLEEQTETVLAYRKLSTWLAARDDALTLYGIATCSQDLRPSCRVLQSVSIDVVKSVLSQACFSCCKPTSQL